MTDKVIDLTAALRARADGQAKGDLEDIVTANLQAAFQILAERRGLSDAWVAAKTAITNEIIAVVARPIESSFITLPTDLTDVQHEMINAAVQEWANAFSARVKSQCLDALARRLIDLALPAP